jgi:hypothetical protein
MDQSFSKRMGLKPLKCVIQINSMDDELRTALWNDFYIKIWNYASQPQMAIQEYATYMQIYYFHNTIDYFPGLSIFFTNIRQYFFNCDWDSVYDFIEITANVVSYSPAVEEFIYACNTTLERELSAYRFVDKKLVQVTSSQEIAEIEEAIGISKQFTQHLDRALELLADRKSPDYRNSIKESISAVEAICQLITGNSKATLGKALGLLEEKLGTVHPALKEAFSKVYGYTNDDQGIRHALIGESNLSAEDAKFMGTSSI